MFLTYRKSGPCPHIWRAISWFGAMSDLAARTCPSADAQGKRVDRTIASIRQELGRLADKHISLLTNFRQAGGDRHPKNTPASRTGERNRHLTKSFSTDRHRADVSKSQPLDLRLQDRLQTLVESAARPVNRTRRTITRHRDGAFPNLAETFGFSDEFLVEHVQENLPVTPQSEVQRAESPS